MHFYSALKEIVDQIPAGKVAFVADVADALGDSASAIAIPRALRKIRQLCANVTRVVKSDGSLVFEDASGKLRKEGIAFVKSRLVDTNQASFCDFKTSRPLRNLRATQFKCAKRVVIRDSVKKPKTIAAVDVAYDEDEAFSAAVLMDAEELDIISVSCVNVAVDFPYVPGYLAFRELPPMLSAIRKLPEKPSLLFVDGQGILHPARCGIASHVGVRTRIPTIGIGKSHLVGEVETKRIGKGEAAPIRLDGKIRGYALCSLESRRPIFISPGNLITPKTALRLTSTVCHSRIPEPIRQAHAIANKMKMEIK